jgi:hypothetical protein
MFGAGTSGLLAQPAKASATERRESLENLDALVVWIECSMSIKLDILND